jgi:signal peptidase I
MSEVEGLDRSQGFGVAELLVEASIAPRIRVGALTLLAGILLTGCSTAPTVNLTTNGACIGPTESFVTSGVNMEPTIAYHQSVTVDLGAFRYTKPQRGDIVLLRPPREPDVSDTTTIDRVIGLPGERISSVGSNVEIDGSPLPEPWLVRGSVTLGVISQLIPTGEYFVMGDNRGLSVDSRIYGPVNSKAILGKVVPSGCGK